MEINPNAPVTAEGEIHIAANPETVLEVVATIEEWPTWNPDVKSVTLQGPVAPGSDFRWKGGPSTLRRSICSFEPRDGGTLAGILGALKEEAERRSFGGSTSP